MKELQFIAEKFLFWWNMKTTPIQPIIASIQI